MLLDSMVAGLLDPNDDEDVAAVHDAIEVKSAKQAASLGQLAALLVVSLLLFLASEQGSGRHTLEWLASLVVVLAVHEGGHYLAMRAFGYTDLKVFFIPFFGAAASGRNTNASATQRAIVSLMGPLPGLVLVLVATLVIPHADPWVRSLLWLALVLNAFNLLPIVPLDGGRYLDTTLFARWPVMRQVVGHLSGLAMAGIGWALDAWLLVGLGALTFLFAGASRLHALMAGELRDRIDPSQPVPAVIPEALVPAGIDVANRLIFSQTRGPVAASRYANLITGAWSQAGNRPPSLGRTMVLLTVYLLSIGVAVLAAAMLL